MGRTHDIGGGAVGVLAMQPPIGWVMPAGRSTADFLLEAAEVRGTQDIPTHQQGRQGDICFSHHVVCTKCMHYNCPMSVPLGFLHPPSTPFPCPSSCASFLLPTVLSPDSPPSPAAVSWSGRAERRHRGLDSHGAEPAHAADRAPALPRDQGRMRGGAAATACQSLPFATRMYI